MKEVCGRNAGQDPSHEPSHTRRKHKTECERRRAPWRRTIRTRNQVTNTALDSTAAGLLFHLASTSAANVANKRGAQDAGDPVFCNKAAQTMSSDSQQCQIKQTESLRQTILLYSHAR